MIISAELRRVTRGGCRYNFFCTTLTRGLNVSLSLCQLSDTISPLRRDGSHCCHGSTEEPPKSASCSGWMGRETKQTRQRSFRAATNSWCVATIPFKTRCNKFFFVLGTLPPPRVLPGHSFAVHKASVGSFHDFETQVCSVHADEMEGKRKREFQSEITKQKKKPEPERSFTNWCKLFPLYVFFFSILVLLV